MFGGCPWAVSLLVEPMNEVELESVTCLRDKGRMSLVTSSEMVTQADFKICLFFCLKCEGPSPRLTESSDWVCCCRRDVSDSVFRHFPYSMWTASPSYRTATTGIVNRDLYMGFLTLGHLAQIAAEFKWTKTATGRPQCCRRPCFVLRHFQQICASYGIFLLQEVGHWFRDLISLVLSLGPERQPMTNVRPS
jgi:hypothetical protein